ncbi:MAG: hypothetical protein RJQ09_02855 [Cyclobacteriaceae bacterium]
MPVPDHQLPVINRLISFIVVFMSIGTMAELLLIGHYEDSWQLLPIILIASSMVVFILIHWRKTALTGFFKTLMIACAISGLIGLWFHLNANFEFEKEMYPTHSFGTLLLKSLTGALPVLAPGSMIVFGSIGYLYVLLKQQTFQ